MAKRRVRQQTTERHRLFDEYRNDPVGFARECLGLELSIRLQDGTAVDYQARIARAILRHDAVAVRSGHKVGKSLLAVVIALWWVCTRPGSRAILTSSTDRQVKRVLWRELRNMHRRAPNLFPEPALDPATGIQWDDGREIIGFATKIPENAAGFSGEHQLFILDEASGILDEVWEAFEGNTAGGAKVLAFSNPTRTEGWFFDAFHRHRNTWHIEHLSCLESPNYIAGEHLVPGLATREYVTLQANKYGVESPVYDVRVAGRFPTQAANSVIGIGLLEQALARWGDVDPGAELDLGVDVARFGDDESVITARRGLVAYTPDWIEKRHPGLQAAIGGYDTIQVAGMVRRILLAMRDPGEAVRIKVDVIGYGAGVYDQLQAWNVQGELGVGVEVISVNVSERPTDEDYYRLRDQLWFAGRDWLMEGGTFQGDAELERELLAPTYGFAANGRDMKVASKDEIKKTLKRSPDRADSLLLAIYEGGSVGVLPEAATFPNETFWGTEGHRIY